MTIDDKTTNEKLQFFITWETAGILALSFRKRDKYEYLKGEEILPFNKSRMIELAKFTYSPLRKAFEKQTKIIE